MGLEGGKGSKVGCHLWWVGLVDAAAMIPFTPPPTPTCQTHRGRSGVVVLCGVCGLERHCQCAQRHVWICPYLDNVLVVCLSISARHARSHAHHGGVFTLLTRTQGPPPPISVTEVSGFPEVNLDMQTDQHAHTCVHCGHTNLSSHHQRSDGVHPPPPP